MVAVASSRWMLHIGGGWGDPLLLCKALWVPRKALYKCIELLFIINGACHIWQGNISVIRHFQIPLFFGALLLPQFLSQSHEWGVKTCGKPWNGPSYTIETAFQLNITLDHSVIETRGRAHLTQTTNQHLRIIGKLSSHAPSNHLEHLSNTSHRLPLKEIKGISQDRSVIETWGWARLTRGSKQPILNHLNTHWPRPSNHCRAP